MSFKRLDPEDFVFDSTSIAAPAWLSNTGSFTSSLVSFYTSSLQQSSDSAKYYIDVYNSDPITDRSAKIQFSIAFGDIQGRGALWYNQAFPNVSPSKTVYSQFVNLLLGEDENTSFNFGGIGDSNYFFAIVINRSCYKQSIMPGSIQIRGLSGANVYLTDNSKITPITDYTPAGRRYILGSGSFGDGVTPPSNITIGRGIYGYVYPDVGIIILNPVAFDQGIIEGTPSAFNLQINQNNNNPAGLFHYLTQFTLQSQETVSSNYIFCRVRNAEFNFSTQNNFISSTRNITGSSDVTPNEFIQTPPTYITSVGLYNDNNELLAVAKLSKPLKKDFNTEALIRVKLDF